ncbi:hypothetical protein M405DRAFT_937017 [Rhizopogon salebrosus TDB-379]|nr:hypothetical protein M405DRAFT_937017 [Rhizopogon salebrosus TDB-379]
MSESASSCTTPPPLPEVSPWSSTLLIDELGVTVIPPPSPHIQQPGLYPPYIIPPPRLFSPESDDGRPYTPFIPPLPSPEPLPLSYWPASYPRSPSPSVLSQPYSPVWPYHLPMIRFEEDDHYVRRWQQWHVYDQLWISGSPPPRVIPRDIDDYFYLNVRSKGKGDNTSLVFSDFSPVLESLLRIVFADVDRNTPLEYPIHRLFQKMDVLRSRLNDARDILSVEDIPKDLTSKAEVFGFKASSGCDAVAQYLADLVTHLGKLLEIVEAEGKEKAERFRESLANNKISVDLLEYYYEEGAVYASNVGIEKDDLDTERRIVPVVLKSACFSTDEQTLNLQLEHLEWDGVRFQKRYVLLVQEAFFQGTIPITSLVLQRMTDETLAKVTERGRLYLSYCRVFYAEYYDDTRMHDELRCTDPDVKSRVRRVMIDPFGFHRAQQGYNPNLRTALPSDAEENIARLPYLIGGYDLDTHEWQKFSIWDLKPVEYDEEAWRNLIVDENTKDFIRALVDTTGHSLHSRKLSKGKNVLLKGLLRTGGMTAVHAVCNLLKRPLLTISAPDLQIGTDQIAYRMSLAVTWNAVIVVKDADDLLKSTIKTSRERVNATLRQLEGDDCISFWVTSGCDKELLSSFCAVIDFPELNAAARRRLWLNHFGRPEPTAHISNDILVGSSFGDLKRMDYSAHLRDIEKLSWHRLDARMIENIMRSARALADSNGEHLSAHHVKLVMKAQQLDNLPLWRKVTRILVLSAKVLHTT